MGLFSSISGIVGSIAGGLLGNKGTKDAGDQNAALQREFAQNGIQWKVEDAKKAGIHPLAALGVQPFNPAPSYSPQTSFADSLVNSSQNIGRAIDASRSADARREALLLENASLQNDLLRSQITHINRADNPAFPGSATVIDGQGNSPSRDRRTIPDVGFAETEQGGLAVLPSKQAKERIEDSLLSEIEWYMRNRINPFAILNGPGKSPRKDWNWSIMRQQYMPPSKPTPRPRNWRGLPNR